MRARAAGGLEEAASRGFLVGQQPVRFEVVLQREGFGVFLQTGRDVTGVACAVRGAEIGRQSGDEGCYG